MSKEEIMNDTELDEVSGGVFKTGQYVVPLAAKQICDQHVGPVGITNITACCANCLHFNKTTKSCKIGAKSHPIKSMQNVV